jgi:hypothetical protein
VFNEIYQGVWNVTPENEKFIQTTDVRIAMSRFSIPTVFADIFITEVLKNDKIHIEDLIAKVRSKVSEYEIQEYLSEKVITSLDDLAGTSFYQQC